MAVDNARLELIRAIQARRASKVLVYFLGDRPGRETQMAEDVSLLVHEHVTRFGKTEKLDVFLYTRGGIIFAPWRLIALLRELVSSIAVLIPFRCHSAGTLFALGADEIVMSRMGELSPVDPQFVDSRSPKIERRSVEDVRAFISFAKERIGIVEQDQLGGVLDKLVEKISAPDLGRIHRGYDLIRLLVKQLLATHMKAPEDEPKIKAIMETMTEKLFDHEYKIGRREAKDLGLNVKFDDEKLESLIWNLYSEYEKLLSLRDPWLPERELGASQTKTVKHVRAAMETENLGHHYISEVQLSRGGPPGQINIQGGLPPNVPPALVQQIAQQLFQQMAPQGVIQKSIVEGWKEI
jgi:hypothetical protein